MQKKILIGLLVATLSFAGFGAASMASAQGIDAKQLVQLLIALGFISPDKVASARAAVGLASSAASSSTQSTSISRGIVRKDGKLGPFVPRIDSLAPAVVAPGDLFTITGVGFDATNTIRLDGIAYEGVSVSFVAGQDRDAALQVAIPERLGSASSVGPHKLVVANENGVSGERSVTVVPRGSSVSGSFTQTCGGTEPPSNGYIYKGAPTYTVGESDTAVWTYGIPFAGSDACRFKCLDGAVWTGTLCSASKSQGPLH